MIYDFIDLVKHIFESVFNKFSGSMEDKVKYNTLYIQYFSIKEEIMHI